MGNSFACKCFNKGGNIVKHYRHALLIFHCAISVKIENIGLLCLFA